MARWDTSRYLSCFATSLDPLPHAFAVATLAFDAFETLLFVADSGAASEECEVGRGRSEGVVLTDSVFRRMCDEIASDRARRRRSGLFLRRLIPVVVRIQQSAL